MLSRGMTLLLLTTFMSATASAPPEAYAETMKRIYVLPMSHLDIGFTAPPSIIAAKMVEMTEKVIDRAAEDPGYVWNFETFWQLDQWLAGKPDKKQYLQLVELVKSGRIGVGSAYVTPHSSMMSSWMLERLCEPAQLWAKRHDIQLDWAVLNDVPGHPPDLPRFLSRAGVKYLVLGINQTFTPKLADKYCNTPFWWEASTGERVLTWICAENYTGAYMRMWFDPPTARFFHREKLKDKTEADDVAIMREGIRRVLSGYEKRGYKHDAILVQHAFDNWGMEPSQNLPKYAKQWNASGQGPQIIISTPKDFFEHISATSKQSFPVYRGGFGGAWERVKLQAPTSVRRMRAAERIFQQSALAVEDPQVRQLVVLYGHTFGLGPGWPGLMTEKQVLQHNRDQAAMVRALPSGSMSWPIRGELAALDIAHDGKLKANGLYLADGIGMWQFVGKNLEPLVTDVWTAAQPRRTEDNTWQFRHRIDRRELTGGRKQVVWAWPIKTSASRIHPKVQTATGWMKLPEDWLDGQFHNGWFSAWATRLDGVEIEADIPLAFCISPEHYTHWIFALCLTQSFDSRFKGGPSRQLTFEEAYPGEKPVLEFTIEVRLAKSASGM